MAESRATEGGVAPAGEVVLRVNPAAVERRSGVVGVIHSWITARLDGDTLRVTVTGGAQFGSDPNRRAVAAIDVPDDQLERIRGALEALLKKHGPQAEMRAELAAFQHAQIMLDRGEDL